MIFYILALVNAYIIALFSSRIKNPIFFLSVLPLILFSTVRGVSGKDTPLYILRFTKFDWFSNGFKLDSEPIFNLIVMLSRMISDNYSTLFLLHSSIVLIMFYLITRKKDARIYLLTVGPMFLIDGLVNGMRITLAYHGFIIATLYSFRSLYVASFFAHVSILITIAAKYTIDKMVTISQKKMVFYSVFLIFFILISPHVFEFLLQFMPRVSHKLEQYSELRLSTGYSGIADLYVIFSLLLLASLYNRSSYSDLILDILMIVVMCSLLFYAVQVSLAFIRVLKLLIVAIALSPILTKSRKRIPSVILLIVGIPYTLNFVRQIMYDVGFLPYGYWNL